jgi:GNAT superfamily N-acetyltransferase
MNRPLQLVFREAAPDPEEYSRLFNTTGWNENYRASAAELDLALANSWYFLCVYTHSNKLIGIGRVLSDGVMIGLLCDLIVQPEFQKQGVGSQIIQRIIQHCRAAGLRVLWLFSAAGKSGFYLQHGFQKRSPDAPGMALNLTCDP